MVVRPTSARGEGRARCDRGRIPVGGSRRPDLLGAPFDARPEEAEPVIHLLPNYDEHFISDKGRRALFEDATLDSLARNEGALDAHIVTRNGLVIGGWRRTISKKEVVIEARLLVPLTWKEQAALRAAADAYGRFLELPATSSGTADARN